MTAIDLIGDIHGHTDELKALLKKLGYEPKGASYQHPEGRTVLFLGDYIDRGPKIKETLAIHLPQGLSQRTLRIRTAAGSRDRT